MWEHDIGLTAEQVPHQQHLYLFPKPHDCRLLLLPDMASYQQTLQQLNTKLCSCFIFFNWKICEGEEIGWKLNNNNGWKRQWNWDSWLKSLNATTVFSNLQLPYPWARKLQRVIQVVGRLTTMAGRDSKIELDGYNLWMQLCFALSMVDNPDFWGAVEAWLWMDTRGNTSDNQAIWRH